MRRHPLLSVSLVLVAVACGRGIEVGTDRVSGKGGEGGAFASSQDASTTSCTVRYCQGKIYACGDCLDNDGDGLIDDRDPECLGACDDLENFYAIGIVGAKDGNCQLDCAFDGDNGAGNDDCHWSHRCDPKSVAPDYPPSGDSQCAYNPQTAVPGTSATCVDLSAAESALCLATCIPLTPAGCDCFGCCNLAKASLNYVWVDSVTNGQFTCDLASLGDPLRCRPCTPVKSCIN